MKFFLLLIINLLSLGMLGHAQQTEIADVAKPKRTTAIADILKELGHVPEAAATAKHVKPEVTKAASIRQQNFTTSTTSAASNQVEHTVANGENPWTIAKKYGVSMDELIELNQIDNARDIKVGQVLKIPEKRPTVEAPTRNNNGATSRGEPFDARGYQVYTILKGENPWTIARKLKVDYEALLEINEIKNPRGLMIGQKLRVPEAGQKSAAVADQLTKQQSLAAVKEVVVAANATDAAAIETENLYQVKKGDDPWTIAKKLEVKYEELISLNGIDDPRKIKIGQKLRIPRKGEN